MFEAAGPDTDILITSDHGFGPTTEIFYLNEWLARNGYLHWSERRQGRCRRPARRRHAQRLSRHDRVEENARLSVRRRAATRSFIKKDNGSGTGVKEEDYLPFVLKLQSELLGVSRSGRRQADRCWRRSEQIARNEFRRVLARISRCILRDGGFVSIAEVGRDPQPAAKRRRHASSRRHIHRPRSKLPQRRTRSTRSTFSTYRRSFSRLMGIPVPSDMEGRVPTEALVGDHEMRKGEATSAPAADSSDRAEPTAGGARGADEPAQSPWLYGMTAAFRMSWHSYSDQKPRRAHAVRGVISRY